MGAAQKVWIEGIQTRVDVTSAMLGVMKVSGQPTLFSSSLHGATDTNRRLSKCLVSRIS